MFDDFLYCYDVFQKRGIEKPLLETLHLFDLFSKGLLSKMDLTFLERENIDLLHISKKRKEGIPLEYIIGKAIFMGRTFFCSPNTLIPREWTKLLVEVAQDFIKKIQESKNDLTIIDIGTGCGNIAITLALNTSKTNVIASDVNPSSVKIAQKNINKFNLQDRVSLFCGDLLSPLKDLKDKEKIDIVVCNPPYIPTSRLCKLSPEITNYEPIIGLNGGPFGIDFCRRLISDSFTVLKHKGILVFEIGIGQKKWFARLLEKNVGYEDVRYFKDSEGIRVVSAVKR